jgi:tetratricopeptide (TPR) repeat protein
MTGPGGSSDDDAHWSAVDACFDEVLDAPESERALHLESLRGKYSDRVIAEVRELLAALDAMPSILSRPAPEQVELVGGPQADDPERVGRWRIIEPLGSGGQGRVYLASKEAEQFEQMGALKMLGDHLGSDAMQRFLRERQTLARLRHPNIAVLLDAGAGEDGRPYLVSELIRGTTLDRYVDSRRPTPVECVRLLLPVVEAVAYAHQQFVLHRDIKPANVIVDEDDVPCLLDFGVAAVIADAAGSPDEVTTPAPYTPSYAAPEQISGSAVDVRTDCWALGAMLYRALAGRNPFAAEDAEGTIDAVLHHEPEPPTGDSELNAIVERCLAKSMDARYEDVGQLRDDLEAWLDDAPVRAATNSRRYLLGKWLRRHRVLAGSGAIVVLSLVLGAGVSAYQAQRAADERDRAASAAQRYETAVGLLVDVFNGANPALHRGQAPSAEDLLAEAYDRVTGMQRRPGVQAALAHELAAVYLNRGQASNAARLAALAVDHVEAGGLPPSARYANSLVSLASAEKMLGRFEPAVAALERSLRVQREHLWSTSDWRYAYTQNMLGSLHTLMGGHEQALALHRKAMQALETSDDAPGWLEDTVFRNYWHARFSLGESDAASRALSGWLESRRPDAAEEPAAYVHASLGAIALADSRYADAAAAYAEAGRLLAAVYGESHRDAVFFSRRATYAQALAGGEDASADLATVAQSQAAALDIAPDAGPVRVRIANHRLSLTPYVERTSRAAWVSAHALDSRPEAVADRLLWHQHLLLRGLAFGLAGNENAAGEALRQAAATELYATSQSRWQREIEAHLAAFSGRGDADSCRALRDALIQTVSIELAVAGRGLVCDR